MRKRRERSLADGGAATGPTPGRTMGRPPHGGGEPSGHWAETVCVADSETATARPIFATTLMQPKVFDDAEGC